MGHFFDIGKQHKSPHVDKLKSNHDKKKCYNIILKASYHNISYWYMGEDLFKEVIRMQFHLGRFFFSRELI